MIKNSKTPLVRAGIVPCLGFGGLADGIIRRQIPGWHHMVCYSVNCQPASRAQLQQENTQDGCFHLAMWLLLLAGTFMLFRAGGHAGNSWPGPVLAGAMLAGSGLFNFLEGLIDHQRLGIHHVLPGSPHQFLYDMLYLANGIWFIFIGGWLIRLPRGTVD